MGITSSTSVSRQLFFLVSLFIGALSFQVSAQTPTTSNAFEFGWAAYEYGDYQEAARIWQPLAEQGDAQAQLNLGTLYDFGQGVQMDATLAVKWYRAAATQGSQAAQFNLGMMYETGRGTPQRYADAALWYQTAAEQGLAIAQHQLGIMYLDGVGVPANNQLALQWLKKAAEQNHADASYQLGSMYANGQGVSKDLDISAHWLGKSTIAYRDQGDMDKVEHISNALALYDSGYSLAYALEKSAPNVSRAMSFDNAEGASFGTAWPVASGHVITNYHVIADSKEIMLINRQGEEVHARVTLTDEINDIALLSVDHPEQLPPALPLSSNVAGLGANVFTIGYPRVDVLGRSPKLSAGLISSENGLEDNPDAYQTSVPIQSGNSGGPLLNMRGEAVGLVASMLGFVDPVTGITNTIDNISFSVKIERVSDLLEQLPEKQQAINELSSQPEGLEALAGRIQDSILVVMVR